jgi:hypothetical protein
VLKSAPGKKKDEVPSSELNEKVDYESQVVSDTMKALKGTELESNLEVLEGNPGQEVSQNAPVVIQFNIAPHSECVIYLQKAEEDSDIDLNNSKKAKLNLALLYKENRDNYKIFSLGRFIITLIKGIFISFFIFISCCIKQILTLQGHFANIWFLSIKTIICVLFVVSANLLINNYFIVIYLPLSILITTYLFFSIFLILNHYGLLFEFNSKATIFPSLASPIIYFTGFLVSCFSIVIDYSFKLFELFFSNSLSSKIILNESLKGKRKSSIRIFNIGTRSYSHNRIKIRKNSAYPLKSKNNYMTKYTLSNKNVLIKNNGQTNLISKFNNSSFDNQYKNIN